MTYTINDLLDNHKRYFGNDEDFSIYFDSSTDRIVIHDEVNDKNVLEIPKNKTLTSTLENGGINEISVSGLKGVLDEAQNPQTHSSSHSSGGSDEISHGDIAGLGNDDHTQYILKDGSRDMTGSLNMGTHRITHVAKPTDGSDAATKSYADAIEQGLDLKDSVRVASNNNIDLSSSSDPNPIDGVTLSDDDRILLKNQDDASENGIYDAVTATDPTTWTRSPDADEDDEVTSGMFCFVEEGDDNANNGYVITTSGDITLGSTDIDFTQFSGAGQIEAGTGLGKSAETLYHSPASVHESGGELEISHNNLSLSSNDHHDKTVTIDELDDVDLVDIAVDDSGNRPSAGTSGRLYIETDTGKILYDNGSSWLEVGLSESEISLSNLESKSHGELDSISHDDHHGVGKGMTWDGSNNVAHDSASVHESGGDLPINHNNLSLGHDDHHDVGTGIKWDDDDNIAHDSASVHEDGGSLEINVDGLSGELKDNQPPKSHGESAHSGTIGNYSQIKNDTITKTSDYTATETDYLIAVNASSDAVTITLPSSPTDGDEYNIKKTDSSSNEVTIDGNGNDIDGESTRVIQAQWNTFTCVYSSSFGSWLIK